MGTEESGIVVGSVLQESIAIINGDRRQSYGDATASFDLLANYWTTYLQSKGLLKDGARLEKPDAAMLLLFLKIARESNKHGHDNVVDMGGYVGLYGDMTSAQEQGNG